MEMQSYCEIKHIRARLPPDEMSAAFIESDGWPTLFLYRDFSKKHLKSACGIIICFLDDIRETPDDWDFFAA
jgi:hypothetical protein